jgi:hypothetical protein
MLTFRNDCLKIVCIHLYIQRYYMIDNDFSRQLDDYQSPPSDPNPDMLGTEIVWVRGNPAFGALHIWQEHRVTEKEVEQVLLEIPPYVAAKRHPALPDRTIFWGATRFDRWLFIVCEDWTESHKRYLRPITAFEPNEGVKYWEKFR